MALIDCHDAVENYSQFAAYQSVLSALLLFHSRHTLQPAYTELRERNTLDKERNDDFLCKYILKTACMAFWLLFALLMASRN